MNTISEYIEYFENLIEGFTHEDYRNLRNRPEVLDEIKGFYNLCFEKMAEGLNELVCQTTGKETTIFNQPVKLGDVQFHFNKLGERAQNASTFEEMAFEIGGSNDPFDKGCYLYYENGCKLIAHAEGIGVHNFLFPMLENYETTDYEETIISRLRSLFVSKGSLSNLDFGKTYAELISKDFFLDNGENFFQFDLGTINQDHLIDEFKTPTPTELTNFVEILVNLISVMNNFILGRFIKSKNLKMLSYVHKELIKVSLTPAISASCSDPSYGYLFEFSGFKFEVSKLKIDTKSYPNRLSTQLECDGRIIAERDTAIYKGTNK